MIYLDLIKQHRRGDLSMGDRPVSIRAIRAAYPEVGWRRWQDWRSRAGCPRGAQQISRLSALKLWLIAGSNGAASDEQIVAGIAAMVSRHPAKLEAWLESIRWEATTTGTVMDSVNSLAPDVDVIHRQRLYEWWGRAGMRFSTKATYNHAQVARAVHVARQGLGRGAPRRARAA